MYPIASARDLAPVEVRSDDPDLANDFDEAAACEPHNRQASAMLLGRCASAILTKKCDAPANSTLGPQFESAATSKKPPEVVSAQYKGLLDNRNRSAHAWFTVIGEPLKVDRDDVDWCFEIVGFLFDHFYIGLARIAARMAKLAGIRAEKA